LTARDASGKLGRRENTMFGLGATELLIILGIVVLLFGARRLPEIGSGLGKAIKNFKSGVSGKDEIDVTPQKPDEIPGRGGPTS
jgi:sec-independent protein translocase protein TatA